MSLAFIHTQQKKTSSKPSSNFWFLILDQKSKLAIWNSDWNYWGILLLSASLTKFQTEKLKNTKDKMQQHNIMGTDGTFFDILQPFLLGTLSVEQMLAEFLMNSVRDFESEFFPVGILGADGFSYSSTSKSSCWRFWVLGF
jgi:hypothetical protein